jgi:hypothetical protein
MKRRDLPLFLRQGHHIGHQQDCIICAINGLTEKTIAYRRHRRSEYMGRLEEKMAQVAGTAERITKSLEERADAVLTREFGIAGRSELYFHAKNRIIDDADQALSKAERALALLSNDPLPASIASPEPPSVPEVAPITPPFQPT